jgi:hypothetical protein
MATLREVIRSGVIDEFGLPEWEDRPPVRSLWVAESLLAWADDTITLHETFVGGRSFFEHLVQMFCDFRCSPKFHHADLKRMVPTNKGVWHMYPAGLRIYGWCPAEHSFIAITGALEKDTKADVALNDAKRDEVLQFAFRHSLATTIQKGDFLDLFPHKG